MKKLLGIAERAFTCFGLMLATDAWIELYIREEGMSFLMRARTVLWVGAIAIPCMILLVGRWKKVFLAVKRGPFLFLFLGIIIFSTLWSDAPGTTANRAFQLTLTTIFGLYFGTRYTLKEQVRLLGWTFLIAAIFSILYVFGMPKLGVTQTGAGNANTGTWRGIFVHKNSLGRMMCVGGILFLINAFNSQKNRWIWWVGSGIAVILIQGANSKTALLLFFFIVVISPFHRLLRWNPYIAIPIYLIVMLVGSTTIVWIADNFADVMQSIDKDPNLNGRVPIWQLLFQMLEDRPWLGFGYGGFWRGWEGEGSAIVMRTIFWKPKQPHNGFIDVLVDLGILGASIGFIGFLINIVRSIICVRFGKSSETLWPLALLTIMLIANQTDNMFMQQYSIQWVLYTALSITPMIDKESASKTCQPEFSLGKTDRVRSIRKESLSDYYKQNK